MADEHHLTVEIAYARQNVQSLLTVTADNSLTIADAIERSGIIRQHPEIDLSVNKVGIHGKLSTLEQTVSDGDRIEIYSPLIADPKQAVRKKSQT
jgi:hypothetical protein